MVEDFVYESVGMNFNTVCVRFVNDVSGDVCEYDEWVIFRKVHDV